MIRRVLCYGDSNTWGYVPGVRNRYPESIRWTGVVQQLLGNGYRILENGLSGRTTVYDDPYFPCRNGLASLDHALLADAPLDLVVLSLGTNDLKFADARQSARGAGRLLWELLSANDRLQTDAPIFPHGPKVLLISPIRIHPQIETINPETTFRGTAPKSAEFSEHFRKLADQQENVFFLDAAKYAAPSDIDGVHMDEASYQKLGYAVADQIRNIFAAAR